MSRRVERLRVLDRLPSPDLWPDIKAREPRRVHDESRGASRAVVAALALAIAAAATVLAVRAFELNERSPRPAALVENGVIAFVTETETDLYVNGAQSGIFVVNPDGSGGGALVDDPEAFEWDPAWSSDGSRIAFVSGGEASARPMGLYVADSDGSGVTLVLEDGTGPTSPSWSPDGRTIVFETGLGHEQTGSGNRDVFAIDVESGELTRLTDDSARDEYPALSPDGNRIAFTRQHDGVVDIYLVNADGTMVTQLTRGEGTDFRPAWSPDSAKIAFERDTDIYVMNADGTGVTSLTDGPAEDRDPTWSPDGTKIAFQRDGDLYVMNADGTAVTRLVESPQFESNPTWQPVPVEEQSPEPTETPTPPSPTAVSAHVAGRVQLEGVPGSVAAADGFVWVATYDYGRAQAAVVRIDAATHEVVATIPVDGTPSTLAASGGAVWVPAGEPPSAALLRVDAATDEVTGRVEDVHGPVVVDPTGVWAIDDGPAERDAAVVRIDPETLQIEARVPVGESPFDLVAGAGSIWLVANETRGSDVETGDLLRIDAATGQVAKTIPIESAGIWIAADDAGVWVSAWDPDQANDAKAYFIDASTNTASGDPGDVYNFRPFAVADGRVWFISGPHDPGLPDGGVCGLNVVTRAVDVCVEPESASDLELAHDPAAFDPVTHSIWIGAFEKPWITWIDVVPTP
jgi:dipeptidyl aminopeptidase/acylaminoacyl peptidase